MLELCKQFNQYSNCFIQIENNLILNTHLVMYTIKVVALMLIQFLCI